MAGLYFEQFVIGHVFKHAVSRTVNEMDNTLFSVMTMNMQPLHLDAHFSEQTEFGQRIVNSLSRISIASVAGNAAACVSGVALPVDGGFVATGPRGV